MYLHDSKNQTIKTVQERFLYMWNNSKDMAKGGDVHIGLDMDNTPLEIVKTALDLLFRNHGDFQGYDFKLDYHQDIGILFIEIFPHMTCN